jgi:hypothetical protein
VRIITHDDGLIESANGHIESGPGPDCYPSRNRGSVVPIITILRYLRCK